MRSNWTGCVLLNNASWQGLGRVLMMAGVIAIVVLTASLPILFPKLWNELPNLSNADRVWGFQLGPLLCSTDVTGCTLTGPFVVPLK